MGWILESPHTLPMGLIEEAIFTGAISAVSMALLVYWIARMLILGLPHAELNDALDRDLALARRIWLALRIMFGTSAVLAA